MIASADEAVVREAMCSAGFTNISVHETVMFFSRPGSSLRVDFLKVNQDTIDKLLANALEVDYFAGHTVRVPQLKDLLAMKLFALASGGAKREEKDFSDIVNLTLENDLDPVRDLYELCQGFGTDEIYERVCARVKELRHD